MARLARLIGVASIAALTAATGCGTTFTIQTGTGGADTASDDAGSVGTTTVTSTSSSSGGPPPCAPGACGAGNYCEKSTAMCRACSDLSHFTFHAPVPVSLGTPTSGTTASYPRTNPDTGELYFTYVDKSSIIPRGRTTVAPPAAAPLTWGAWAFAPSPINVDGQNTAPLYLHDGAALMGLVDPGMVDTGKPVLLFDSDRFGSGMLQIFAANVGAPGVAQVSLPGGTRDSRVAVAPGVTPPRFWYISNGGTTMERLVTVAAGSSQPKPVPLTLDKGGCPGTTVDAPWVTLDGNHLFFGAAYPDVACDPPTTAPTHLFHVELDDQGQQLADPPIQRLFPDDDTDRDGSPSLSSDLCTLLFTRFDAYANGALYAAVRE